MKTPAQWMEYFVLAYKMPPGSRPPLTEEAATAIQRDAIAHEYARFTEATLTQPGWYFWYPTEESFHNPQFIRIREEQVASRHLRFVPVGTYIGPIDPPKL
jgi:hypothetical protein